MAAAIRRFVLWAIVPSEDNGAWLSAAHFTPHFISLPPHTW